MVSQSIWIAIVIGVFFVGIGISYSYFASTYEPVSMKFQNQELFDKMMSNNPKMSAKWMEGMGQGQQEMQLWMSDPEHANQMAELMRGDHDFTMEILSEMMEDPQLRLQMMGHMTDDLEIWKQMQGMMGSGMGAGHMGQGMMGTSNVRDDVTVKENIARFDHLDFEGFNKQNWEVFNELHAPDVLVGWPDGRVTHGIEEHSKDVEFVFTYAPDVQITDHSISFGQGEWTAGMGIVEGTFSEPMILPDGTVIEPTGNQFNYTMITIAKWQDGQITEEYLFWDNAEVARQMGLN